MPTSPTDILTRLRAANPAPVSPDRANEPTAQATLERILNDPGPDAASRSPERPRPPRRWLRAAPVLAATLVALAVVGGALVLLGRGHGPASGSRPPGGGIGALIAHTPQRRLQRELAYATAATQGVQNSKACQLRQPSGPTYVQGSPGPGLLSILGVLRRPATAADQINPHQLGAIPDVYRAYIRRAFSAGGVSYYIVPSRFDRAATIPSDRCVHLQATALNRYLPRIPAALRQPTREIFAALISYLRTFASQGPGIVLVFVGGNGAFGAGAPRGITAKGIEEGFATENGPAGTFSGVVPDGVATVTLIFPAAGQHPMHAVTSRVEGNVYAVHVPLNLLRGAPPSPTVIWRSPEGRVLKRFSTSPAATLARVCRLSPIACLLGRAATGAHSSSSRGTTHVRAVTARVPGA
jgi:hypothetical protein